MLQKELLEEACSCFNMSISQCGLGITPQLERLGWEYIGEGSYKVVLAKGDLVAKIGVCSYDIETYQLFKKYRLTKYLARSLYLTKSCMVQRRVKVFNEHDMIPEWVKKETKQLTAFFYTRNYILWDLRSSNIGILNGRLKIIDCMISRDT